VDTSVKQFQEWSVVDKIKWHFHRIKRRFYDSRPELPIDPDVVQPGQYKWPPHFSPLLLLTVFIGGCLGAYARYWVGVELPMTPNGFPYATLIVNLLGAFLLGLLLEGLFRLGKDKGGKRLLRLGVGTGFMGAFTTYSSFAIEAIMLFRNGSTATAFTYISVSVIGGLLLSTVGIQVAAIHHKRRVQP
jgi:CrcB protein